jgi:VWFA-related protein
MRSSRIASVFRVLLVALLTATSAGHALQADGRRGQAVPLFKGAVELVRLDVVVNDDRGKPIPDLAAVDFQVAEDGRQQAIATFQHVVAPAASLHEPKADLGESDVVTNVPRSQDGRAFVMVVDDMHLMETDLFKVKRVLTDFINGLAPSDEAAVVFTSRSDLGQNFTSNREALLKSVGHLQAALGFGLDALGRTANDGRYGDPKYMLAAARRVDDVLRNVALSLAGSGQPRRAIVYVSAGSVLPTTPVGSGATDYDFLRDAYEAARRAGAPVYTIDPRGLVQAADAVRGGIGAIGNLGETSDATTGQVSRINSNIKLQQQRLAEIANTTGGRYFTNRADLRSAVNEILADNDDYYLIGFYPSNAEPDGQFHPVSVKVAREGAHVRARPGFLAQPVGSEPSSGAPTAALNASLAAGVNAEGVAIRAVVMPVSMSEKGAKTAVVLEAQYPPRPDGAGPFQDLVTVGAVALDTEGKIVASVQRNLTMKGTPPAGAPFSVLVDDAIELPRKRLVLRVGFASRTTGKAGTVQFDVDLSKDDEAIALGPLAIGSDAPTPPVLNSAALDNLVPFQPTFSRELSVGDRVRVFGALSWRSSHLPVIRAQILGGDTYGPWAVRPQGRLGKSETGTFHGIVPLDVPPGRYTIEIEATIDGHTATQRVLLTVR